MVNVVDLIGHIDEEKLTEYLYDIGVELHRIEVSSPEFDDPIATDTEEVGALTYVEEFASQEELDNVVKAISAGILYDVSDEKYFRDRAKNISKVSNFLTVDNVLKIAQSNSIELTYGCNGTFYLNGKEITIDKFLLWHPEVVREAKEIANMNNSKFSARAKYLHNINNLNELINNQSTELSKLRKIVQSVVIDILNPEEDLAA